MRSCWGRHNPPLIFTLTPAVSPCALPASVSAFAHSCGRARGGAGQVPGAAASPLNHLLGPSDLATYRRTSTKIPHMSFSLHFSPSQWPGCRRIYRHAARHSLAVPTWIGYRRGALAPGAHTACTQPPSLGAPEATFTPLCVCVCVCVNGHESVECVQNMRWWSSNLGK